MDTQTLLGVLGIGATILLGLWAIVITIRYNRSVRITFARDSVITLIDDIMRNFPDLQISFRGQPIGEDLVLLEGYLVNTGSRDITPEMVEQPITMELPSDYEWVECKTVGSSPSLKGEIIRQDKNKVQFGMGLWKAGEYVRFKALAKVPVRQGTADANTTLSPAGRLRQALSFTHRIADSGALHTTAVPRRTTGLRTSPKFGFLRPGNLGKSMFFFSSTYVLFGLALWCSVHFKAPQELGYRITLDGQEHVVQASVKNCAVLLASATGFRHQYSLSDFDALPGKHSRILATPVTGIKVMGLSVIGIGVLGSVISYMRIRRDNRLLAMLGGSKGH